MRFLERLSKKIEVLIRNNKVTSNFKENVDLDASYSDLYESMKRWHVNSHVTESQWKQAFDMIKSSLNVQELMTVPDDLKLFLKRKFAKTSLKEKFGINEMLEFLVSDIHEHYRNQLSLRAENDEVDVYFICTGMRPGDLQFFERSYLPFALFLIYKEKHPNSDRLSLMEDIFSIGAGSRSYDLMPEVTAVCSVCARNNGFQKVDDKDLEIYNLMVLKKQIENDFRMPYEFYEDDSDKTVLSGVGVDENERVLDLSFNKGEEFKGNADGNNWFNPFSSSEDECLSELLEDSDREDYTCDKCNKVFSKVTFLDFHMEWFHEVAKSSVTVKYVEPDDLMLSFAAEEIEKSEVQDKGAKPRKKIAGTLPSKPAKKIARKPSSKAPIKRKLRFKD